MNIKNLLLSACAVALISSCTKEALKVKAGLNAKEVSFVVKASPQSGAMQIDAQNMSFNLDSLCKANSFSKDQITSVKVESVFLDIVDNNATTFDIVDWAEAYVGSIGKADALLASKNPVAKDGVRTIGLDLKDVELVDYIKSNQMSFFAKGQTNKPLANDVQMKARVKFNIVFSVK